MEILQPQGWPRPRGYANGIAASGKMVFVSGMVGWDADGVFHTDDLAGVTAFVERVVSRPGAVERKTFRVTNVHGEWRWIEQTLTNCTDVIGVEGLVANVRDVTNEVEARSALTASERRYRTIVETANEGRNEVRSCLGRQ